MATFKSTAYQILKKAGRPLHSREITKHVLKHGLVSEGKTPEVIMNALLITDINTKKGKSRFIKTVPPTLAINLDFAETLEKIEKEEQGRKN